MTELEAMAYASVAFLAATPELCSVPPTHWIAPWEVTEDMANEMECQFSTETQWSAARDAHLTESKP